MKQSFLLLSLLLSGLASISQTPGLKKVYAYAQGSVPGIRPNVAVSEGGEQQETTTTHERVSYSIYAEQSGTSKVSFNTAWIKGKAYPVKADKVNAPVELKTGEEGGNGKIVLAPASPQSVWLLALGALYKNQPAASSTLRKLIAKNEVVLVYTWRKKVYYYPVKKIKNLPPAIAI